MVSTLRHTVLSACLVGTGLVALSWPVSAQAAIPGADLVSATPGGQAGDGASDSPDVTPDGRFVAFRSAATDLVAGDTNGVSDVFVTDRSTGSTVLVSTASTGDQGNGPSSDPTISANGRYVAFTSAATNLDINSPDTNGFTDVYIKDLRTDQVIRVLTHNRQQPVGGDTEEPALNADGSVLAFTSAADNMVAQYADPAFATSTD